MDFSPGRKIHPSTFEIGAMVVFMSTEPCLTKRFPVDARHREIAVELLANKVVPVLYVSATEASKLTGLSRDTFLRQPDETGPVYFRIGTRKLFPLPELLAWVEFHTTTPSRALPRHSDVTLPSDREALANDR
jgi:hypothetical protein